MRSRVLEVCLLAGVIALLGLLLYPWQPAPLPVSPARPAMEQPAVQPAVQRFGARPSPGEVAALFCAPRPAAAPRQAQPVSPPERVTWLRFIAFVVASDGQAVYLFKNEQSGRVLMLTCGVPRDGWNLAAVQRDAWLLESGGRRYLVGR